MDSPSRERRQFPRVRLLVHPGETPAQARFTLRDVSLGGFAIASAREFVSGEQHAFAFSTVQKTPLVIRATARHSLRINWPERDPEYLSGFEFVIMSATDAEAVAELTRGLTSGRAAHIDVRLV